MKTLYYEGQATFAHDLRMSLKMFYWLFLSVAAFHLCCGVIISVSYLSVFELKLLFMWFFSAFVTQAGISIPIRLAESNGDIIDTTTRLIYASPILRESAYLMLGRIGNVFLCSGFVYLLMPFLYHLF